MVRKVRHVCDGGRRRRRRSLETVRSDTSMPSLPSSPWIRGAPQRGFALPILSTSVRMAAAVLGRPRRVCAECWVQRRRSHWRCQRTTVSGCTTIKAMRQSRQALASSTQNSRSLVRRCGRLTVRRKTASCCRSAKFSSATARCPLQISLSDRSKTTSETSIRYPVAQPI